MTNSYPRLISRGALVALVGCIASGPLGFLLVQFIKPQPAWISPSVFAENYHIIQDVPFYFGFLLTGGMLMLSIGHYLECRETDADARFHLLLAMGLTIAFFTLISINYLGQITFVRNMSLNYKPEYDMAISLFSMANPRSFCWSNEIWGYGFLGVATWLTAGYYAGRSKTIRLLLIINGIVSIATIVFIIINGDWLMTSVGLSAYLIWNALMISLLILIYKYSSQSSRI